MPTSQERISAALSFQEADRVPVIPLVCGASRRVDGLTYREWSRDPELAARSFLQAQELLGYDSMVTLADLSVEAAGFGAKIHYPLEDTPHPDYDASLIQCIDDYDRLRLYDPRAAHRTREMIRVNEILVQEKGEEVPTIGFMNGPLCTLSMMRGCEALFKDCIKYPAEVKAALEVVTQVLLDYAQALCATGIPALCVDVLYASRSALSPNMWGEIDAPFARRITEEIRSLGVAVALHNCGKGPYFDLMIEHLEPDLISYHYLPPDCKTTVELKEKYGRKVTLAGQVSCPTTLFLGTPQDVQEECRNYIEDLSQGGGFILASGCEFPPNASLLNAKAMVEAAEVYGACG